MSNPLDPIWDAYQTSRNALKVVRRCATLPDLDAQRPFRNTRFHGLSEQDCVQQLDEAEAELDDLAVLSLYAAFEARLREHVCRQADLLRGATSPAGKFASALADLFEDHCEEARMDRVVALFRHAVGENLVAQVGHIRVFRHWVAHGRRGQNRPDVAPLFAYRTLSEFLSSARLL